jgi:2-oxo-4-hydroxy-4-carboxy-5-ureidoimidazoline decarboxylase
VSRLEWLNGLPFEEAKAEFMRCCGSSRWADAMARARPFKDISGVYAEAAWLWKQTGPEDWREAFTHHPRIGDVSQLRAKFAATANWSSQEQGGVSGADEAVLQGLAEGNAEYEKRFGFIFLVCATGKSAAEMLGLLRARLDNAPDEELRIAAEEQAKITRIRLEKLFTSV